MQRQREGAWGGRANANVCIISRGDDLIVHALAPV